MKPAVSIAIAVASALMTAASAGAYQEAPMLAELVKAGKLPPVEQRLPQRPLVEAPVNSIGKYGGTWRRMAMGSYDTLQSTRLGYGRGGRRKKTTCVPGTSASVRSSSGAATSDR